MQRNNVKPKGKQALAALAAVAFLMLTSASFVAVSGDNADAEKGIPIGSLDDLRKIGNDVNYPLDGNYAQTADIIFDKTINLSDNEYGDHNKDGFPIKLEIKETAAGTVITLYDARNSTPGTVLIVSEGLISVNGVIYDLGSGDQATVTVTTPSDNKYDISAGGIATNSTHPALANGETADDSFALAYTGTGQSETLRWSNGNFVPIGTYDDPFSGTYYGGDHEIRGLDAAVYGSDHSTCSGLFGYAEGVDRSFSNISLTGAVGSVAVSNIFSYSDTYYKEASAGSIAGYAVTADPGGHMLNLTNCSVSADTLTVAATVSSTLSEQNYGLAYAGGMVGYATTDSVTGRTISFTDCSVSADFMTVTATVSSRSLEISAFSGGIAGFIDGVQTLTGCSASADNITITAASSSSSDTESYSIAEAYSGGIAGQAIGSSVDLTDCSISADTLMIKAMPSPSTTAEVHLDAEAYAGGIAGNARGDIVNITDCSVSADTLMIKAMPSLSSTAEAYPYAEAYAGGIVGIVGDSTLSLEKCAVTARTVTIGAASSSSSDAYSFSGGIAGHVLAYENLNFISCSVSADDLTVTSAISSFQLHGFEYSGAYAGSLIGYLDTGLDTSASVYGNVTSVNTVITASIMDGGKTIAVSTGKDGRIYVEPQRDEGDYDEYDHYSAEKEIVMTFIPDGGYIVSEVRIDGRNMAITNNKEAVFTVDTFSDHNAFVVFALPSQDVPDDDPVPMPQYNITVNVYGGTGGTAYGTGVYDEGAVLTITATAKNGYTFKSWSDGNTSPIRTITVTGDAVYTATFVKSSSSEVSGSDDFTLLACVVAIAAAACGVLLILLYWVVYSRKK